MEWWEEEETLTSSGGGRGPGGGTISSGSGEFHALDTGGGEGVINSECVLYIV